MIAAAAVAIATVMLAILTFGRFARSETWRATVTPLASIIGSGFLICGPLLAREFGAAAILAMAVLLALGYAVGAVIRFNIIHVENQAKGLAFHDAFAWTMRAGQAMLAIAYAVSVAYYLKLLAEFLLEAVHFPETSRAFSAKVLVTGLIVALTALTFSGSIRKIEHAAHASVSIKLSLIAGLLGGLALWWITGNGASTALPPARISWNSVPLLLGLLITIQGFETSRYLGSTYDQALRIRTMRLAQWISSAIYLVFLALLTPVLNQASQSTDVAGILAIMRAVAPILALFVLGAAVTSQVSAAIADSIGSGGLMVEVSRQRLNVRTAFAAASTLSIAVVWLTDPFEVIALSSRAFAAFYAIQCALACWVSIRTGAGGWPGRVQFALTGAVCVVAALAGAPAES